MLRLGSVYVLLTMMVFRQHKLRIRLLVYHPMLRVGTLFLQVMEQLQVEDRFLGMLADREV